MEKKRNITKPTYFNIKEGLRGKGKTIFTTPYLHNMVPKQETDFKALRTDKAFNQIAPPKEETKQNLRQLIQTVHTWQMFATLFTT